MTNVLTELRYLRGTQWLRKGYTAKSMAAEVFTGTEIPAGANIQTALTAGATGQTFVLTAPATQPYRLTSALVPKQGQVIATNSGAVIKGSKVLTGWTKDGTNARWYKDGVLPASYTDVGQCNVNSGAGANPCQKREQVFLNDAHLDRVMQLTDLGPGKFYEDFTANRTWLGDDPTGKLVEMSSTDYAVNATVTGVRLTNLTFQHFASPSQKGAVYVQGADWIVDHCTFTWNHASGLYLANADRAYVHHNTMRFNGQAGMSHYSSSDTRVEYNTFSDNNTDGYWPLDWESAGLKVTFSNRAKISNNVIQRNTGLGLWFDIDNQGCIAENNLIEDNVSCGIRYEISFDAIIRNNTIRRNGFGHTDPQYRNGSDGSGFATAGINVNCSSGGYEAGMGTIDIYGNEVTDNQNGIHIQKRNRGNSGTYPTRPWTLANVKVHDNTVTMRGRSNDQFGWGSSGIGQLNYTDDAVYHTQGNVFSANTYYLDSLASLRFRYWNTAYNQMLSFAKAQAAGFGAGSVAFVAPRTGFRVLSSADDGNWASDGTTTYASTATTNRIGHFSVTDFNRKSYVRVIVNIPQGAVIDSAVLEVLPSGINGTIPPMFISGEAADNAAQITGRTNADARVRTTATVAWTPAAWAIGTWLQSPDISSVLQEIVNRPGWVSGNAVQLFIEAADPTFTTQQQINFNAFDGTDATQAAGIVATWH